MIDTEFSNRQRAHQPPTHPANPAANQTVHKLVGHPAAHSYC
jgi:hypothetical protein